MKGRPITPDDVSLLKTATIPPEVFDAFNECIAQNWHGFAATVNQDDVVAAIVERGIDKETIFAKRYLDVEDSYRAAGWVVVYDKPAYNESYPATFTFTKERRTS